MERVESGRELLFAVSLARWLQEAKSSDLQQRLPCGWHECKNLVSLSRLFPGHEERGVLEVEQMEDELVFQWIAGNTGCDYTVRCSNAGP